MDTPSSSADVVNDHYYKLVYFSNELPSDEHIGAHLRRLQALSKDRRHPILKVFLDDATDVLRQELRKLPSNLLSLIAPFESIIDFAYQFGLRTGPFGGSTEGVFACLIQLGTYIRYVLISSMTALVTNWLLATMSALRTTLSPLLMEPLWLSGPDCWLLRLSHLPLACRIL